MTLNDVATLAKQLTRETNSDVVTLAQMESYVQLAYFDWSRDLMWPETNWKQLTATPTGATATAQEYQLPVDINQIFRVYINGQRCIPTTIPLLEGDVIGLFSPNWRIIPSITIPALTASTVLAIPITSGPAFAQLSYYVRGGYLGFAPAPSTDGYPIIIEGCAFPPTPGDGDTLLLPDFMKHGLAYGAIHRFLLGTRRVQEAAQWKAMETEQWGFAMRWRRNMSGNVYTPFIQPMGYRTWYGRGTVSDVSRATRRNFT